MARKMHCEEKILKQLEEKSLKEKINEYLKIIRLIKLIALQTYEIHQVNEKQKRLFIRTEKQKQDIRKKYRKQASKILKEGEKESLMKRIFTLDTLLVTAMLLITFILSSKHAYSVRGYKAIGGEFAFLIGAIGFIIFRIIEEKEKEEQLNK